jgi:hypothetical protein
MTMEPALKLQSRTAGKNWGEQTPQGKELEPNEKGHEREP